MSTAPFRVTCLEVDAGAARAGHHHALGVETRLDVGGTQRWRPIQVIATIRDGGSFVAEADPAVELEPALCPICPFVTLRPSPSGSAIPGCGRTGPAP